MSQETIEHLKSSLSVLAQSAGRIGVMIAETGDKRAVPDVQQALQLIQPGCRVCVVTMPAAARSRRWSAETALARQLWQAVGRATVPRNLAKRWTELYAGLRTHFDWLVIDGAEHLDREAIHRLRRDQGEELIPVLLLGRDVRLLKMTERDPELADRLWEVSRTDSLSEWLNIGHQRVLLESADGVDDTLRQIARRTVATCEQWVQQRGLADLPEEERPRIVWVYLVPDQPRLVIGLASSQDDLELDLQEQIIAAVQAVRADADCTCLLMNIGTVQGGEDDLRQRLLEQRERLSIILQDYE